jgi:hypothetical protein
MMNYVLIGKETSMQTRRENKVAKAFSFLCLGKQLPNMVFFSKFFDIEKLESVFQNWQILVE